MTTALFMDGEASDLGYCNIRDAKRGSEESARYHCEYLWIFFQHHADQNFREAMRSDFDARYWEMYLTTSLILAGYSVTCPKPGPDVSIVYKEQRIWFEATTPTGGAEGKENTVPDMVLTAPDEEPVVQDVPEDKILLRYLNSIKTKYTEQYAKWLEMGVVSDKDAFVIAINSREIPFNIAGADPPWILQAAYPVGAPSVDLGTGKSGYHFRKEINKEGSARTVGSGVFLQKDYAGLSGLLCSREDAVNRPGEMGDDFELAPNPNATVTLLEGFRLRGVYYGAKVVKDGFEITPVRSRRGDSETADKGQARAGR